MTAEERGKVVDGRYFVVEYGPVSNVRSRTIYMHKAGTKEQCIAWWEDMKPRVETMRGYRLVVEDNNGKVVRSTSD